MTLSRRSFLEMGTLTATGLMLRDIESPLTMSSSTLASGTAVKESSARLSLGFNQGWLFFREDVPSVSRQIDHAVPSPKKVLAISDNHWEQVALPHSVRLEPVNASGGRNFQGICWYRKHFELKPEWRNRTLYLNFQGAMQLADVWLNGFHLTTHFGGYLPFTIDISTAARFGQENILTVRLDNSDNPEVPPGKPQDALDFSYFGGLYRTVQLQVLQPLHISDPVLANKVAGGGVFVTYAKVGADAATVAVQTDIVNDGAGIHNIVVVQELFTRDGKLVATTRSAAVIEAHSGHTAIQSMLVSQPRLWHPDDPNLYSLHTAVIENDRVMDEQDIRIGIRTIHFDKDQGLSINGRPFFSIGGNRHQDHPYVGYALPASAHYRDARKLREAGFTSYRSHYPQDPSFMDACDQLGILAIVSNPGWQFVGDDLFKQRVYQGAREMIRRDRNRPAVIMWEAQLNESDNRSIAAELHRIVHQEYPGPECYASGDHIASMVEDFNGWDVEYADTNESKPWWIREWGDEVDNWGDQQGRVRVARGWGESPMLSQSSGHMQSLDKIYGRARVPAGADLWAGIDAYRGYHHQPFLGAPLDLFRLPKFDYFMFQSQRPVGLRLPGIDSGPMVFIANFATAQSPTRVTVYSNCDEVRLYQNGKEVGRQKPDAGFRLSHPPFSFEAREFSQANSMLFANGIAQPGTEIGQLKAEGLIGGEVVASHLLHAPGVPVRLELKPDLCGHDLVADGSDWIRVYAHVCDARGTTYPYADDIITFSVSGQGGLIGDANSRSNPVRAEAGIATALVRATRNAGPVTVRAAAFGLKEAVTQFESKPEPVAQSL